MDLYNLKQVTKRYISFIETDIETEEQQRDSCMDTKLECFVNGKIDANKKSLEYLEDILKIAEQIEITNKIINDATNIH